MRQAVISAQDKRLGIADNDMQPVKHAGFWVKGAMLVGILPQGGDVTAVAIAPDHAVIRKTALGKFLDRGLLDILGDLHF